MKSLDSLLFVKRFDFKYHAVIDCQQNAYPWQPMGVSERVLPIIEYYLKLIWYDNTLQLS